jgi:predicted N-formylglutamate amidohydrolase
MAKSSLCPKDGVTHTLKHHAIPRRLNYLMLETRNDLIATPKQQQEMAAYLTDLVELALLETPK